MLGQQPLIAFVGTSDLAAAAEFYGSRLGLPVAEVSDFAVVVEAPNAMLRVTLVGSLTPAGHTVLGWQVDNMATAVRDLRERGIEFARFEGLPQDADGVWTTPDGAKVAWFHDPDGNTLSLTEFAPTP